MIMDLRERARKDWGTGFTLRRFHAALMDAGIAAARAAGHRDRARVARSRQGPPVITPGDPRLLFAACRSPAKGSAA